MDKKRAIFNFSMAFAMLFAILFQSLHSVEHLAEQFTTEHCHHQPSESKTQITHQHHNLDHCAICDFTFSSFVAANSHSFNGISSQDNFADFFFPTSDLKPNTGRTISLRGPPCFIV